MGTLGNSVRKLIRNIIINGNIRTSITLTPITRTKGDDGGHGAVTETDGTSRTVYGVPSDYVQDRVEMLKLGDLRTGEVRVLVRDDETLDTNDKVTFENNNYNIRTINPIEFNEVIVVQELILSKRLG